MFSKILKGALIASALVASPAMADKFYIRQMVGESSPPPRYFWDVWGLGIPYSNELPDVNSTSVIPSAMNIYCHDREAGGYVDASTCFNEGLVFPGNCTISNRELCPSIPIVRYEYLNYADLSVSATPTDDVRFYVDIDSINYELNRKAYFDICKMPTASRTADSSLGLSYRRAYFACE